MTQLVILLFTCHPLDKEESAGDDLEYDGEAEESDEERAIGTYIF